MTTRRAFLSALAALPGLRWIRPRRVLFARFQLDMETTGAEARGLQIRHIWAYDPINGRWVTRIDVLFGARARLLAPAPNVVILGS